MEEIKRETAVEFEIIDGDDEAICSNWYKILTRIGPRFLIQTSFGSGAEYLEGASNWRIFSITLQEKDFLKGFHTGRDVDSVPQNLGDSGRGFQKRIFLGKDWGGFTKFGGGAL